MMMNDNDDDDDNEDDNEDDNDDDDHDDDDDDDEDEVDDNDHNDCLHHHILRVTASVEVVGYLACTAHCIVAPSHAQSM